MAREIVNEASTLTVRVSFFGLSGAEAPQSGRYLIKDVTNDRVVRDWTEFTPDTVNDIQIIASDNEVYCDDSGTTRRFEERVLTVQVNYDTDNQYSDEYRYVVRNLRGFES